MKYVILTHHETKSRELRTGFGIDCAHRDLAQSLKHRGYEPTSAGFFYFDAAGRAVTFGESEGLQLRPDAGDAQFITRLNDLAFRTAPKTGEIAA